MKKSRLRARVTELEDEVEDLNAVLIKSIMLGSALAERVAAASGRTPPEEITRNMPDGPPYEVVL